MHLTVHVRNLSAYKCRAGKNRDFFKVKKIRFMKKFVGASMYIAVVKVCSPCPRLYIAVAVAVNTTVCSMIQTWVLSHRSRTCNTPHLMLCRVTRLNNCLTTSSRTTCRSWHRKSKNILGFNGARDYRV